MKKTFLIISLLTLIFSACKKSSPGITTCALTEANFEGTYKVSSVKYKLSANAAEVDGTGVILQSCELDDITTFSANHTFAYSDIGVQCNPNGSYTGTWNLSGNSLTLDGDVSTIENFSCTGFQIVQSDYLQAGDKATITLKKQ